MTASLPGTVQRDLEELSRRRARFVWPLLVAALLFYFAVLGALAYLPSLVGTRVVGSINLAYVLAVSLFVVTFAVAVLNARWARRSSDPLAASINDALVAAGYQPGADVVEEAPRGKERGGAGAVRGERGASH